LIVAGAIGRGLAVGFGLAVRLGLAVGLRVWLGEGVARLGTGVARLGTGVARLGTGVATPLALGMAVGLGVGVFEQATTANSSESIEPAPARRPVRTLILPIIYVAVAP
jgi:hypothetical protein